MKLNCIRRLFSALLFCLVVLTTQVFSQDRLWNIELANDYATHGDVFEVAVLFEDYSELIMSNNEKTTFYFAVTRTDKLLNRLSLRYGLSVSDKGFVRNYTFINPNVGNGVFWTWEIQRNIYYIGIPVLLSFNSIGSIKKLSGYVEFGLVPEFLIKNSNKSNLPDRILEYNFKAVALGTMFSVGIQYKVSRSFTLMVGPQVRKSLIGYGDKVVPSGTYEPFSYGISVGSRFTLGKN